MLKYIANVVTNKFTNDDRPQKIEISNWQNILIRQGVLILGKSNKNDNNSTFLKPICKMDQGFLSILHKKHNLDTRKRVKIIFKFKLTNLASSTIWSHFWPTHSSKTVSHKHVEFSLYIETCDIHICSKFQKHTSNGYLDLDINVQKSPFLSLTDL